MSRIQHELSREEVAAEDVRELPDRLVMSLLYYQEFFVPGYGPVAVAVTRPCPPGQYCIQ